MPQILKRLLLAATPSSLLLQRGPAQSGAVALTFDDGPHPEYTPAILDALAHQRATATFFVVGKCARRHPELIRRIVSEGHTLGCHTDTHVDLTRVGFRDARRECQVARECLEQLSKQRIRYLRPPWGRIGLNGLPVALLTRMTLTLWSLDSHDHLGLTPEELTQRLKTAPLGAGDIVLLHDDGANTAAALPDILSLLRDRQLRSVSLDELFQRSPDRTPVRPAADASG